MPVFEPEAKQTKTRLDGAGRLIVSGVESPSEHFILDESLPVTHTYEFGGPGQKEVVVGKGMIVGVKPEPAIDYETGKSKTVVTLAGKDGARAIGLAPFNFAKHTNDFLDGNRPNVVTHQYIEVPYFADPTKAAKHNYGAVIDGDTQDSAPLANGDYVTYSRNEANYGKMVKYDASKGHKPEEIIGQVWALEMDAQVQGWLKWILFDEAALREDSGAVKGQYKEPSRNGFPFDPEYREGNIDVDGYLSQYTTNPTGVPGLFNGKVRGPVDKTKTVTLSDKDGVVLGIELDDTDIVEGSVKVIAGDVDVTETLGVEVDLKKGIVYYTASAQTTGEAKIEYKAETYGTPTHLDFDGVLGAARILFF